MKNNRFYIGFCAILFATTLLVGCGTSSLPANEYVSYVQSSEGGLLATVQQGDLVYTAQYEPQDYFLLRRFGDALQDDALYDSLCTASADLQYYTLRISATNGAELLKANIQSDEEYYNRIKYYSFDIQKDICLVQGNDTLPCIMTHFERSYELSPFLTISLAFEQSDDLRQDKNLFIHDRVFLQSALALEFSSANLKKIPALDRL
jgi:hypothetical protein